LHHLCLPYSSPFPCLASNTHTLTHRYTTHTHTLTELQIFSFSLAHSFTLIHTHTHTHTHRNSHTRLFLLLLKYRKNIPSFSGSPTLFLKIGTLKTLEQVLKKTLSYFSATSFKTITDMTIS
jgi:hypothetical protein